MLLSSSSFLHSKHDYFKSLAGGACHLNEGNLNKLIWLKNRKLRVS